MAKGVIMSKKISAARYDSLIVCRHISWGTYITINENTLTLLHELESHLSKIKISNGDKYWTFWVKAAKGSIEDFGDYEQLHDVGEYNSYDEFVNHWEQRYPKDFYWYKIEFVSRNDYYMLVINGSVVISISPERKPQSWGNDFSELLEALIEEVDGIVGKLEDGTYNDWINNELPHRYRFGTIMRKDLWALDDSFKSWELKDLDSCEIEQFLKFISENTKTDTPDGRIKNMTAQDYFNFCALCYRAAKFEDADKLSAKELYDRYADRRDGHLREIDENSSELFSEWYHNPDRPGDLAESSHRWEIVGGSTHTRIHLYVMRDEQGYYLSLAGGIHCRSDEIVRMYNALCLNNIPVRLYAYKSIADKVAGRGKVGIVPCYDIAYHYWYGGFYDAEVVSFLSYDEENFPEDIEDKVKGLVEWKPLDKLELAD